MLLRTEREPSQVWQEDPAMHQLHRVSGVRGSGFSHPPLSWHEKSTRPHCLQWGWGVGIRQPSMMFQTGPARMPLLRAPMSTSTPPTLEGWIQFPCVDICNSTSPACDPSSLKCSPLSQESSFKSIPAITQCQWTRARREKSSPGSGGF